VAVRKIIDDVLLPGHLEQAYYSNTTDNNTKPTALDYPPSPKMREFVGQQYVDSAKLKGLINKELEALMHQKKEAQSNQLREANERLRLEVSIAAVQGSRKTMEDQYIAIIHLNELLGLQDCEPQSFFGVYDGHSGKTAAEYSRVHLHFNMIRDELFKTNIDGAIQNSYKRTDKDFNDLASREGMSSGTTAVTALVRRDAIYIANVGDSEAVLCQNGKATLISFAHLPEKEVEKERISKSGGTVIWYGRWRVNGLLSVSRSIGDINLKDVCIPVPHIVELQRSEEDDFLILATDGLWDVMTHQGACDFVTEQLKTSQRKDISQLLVDEAMRKKTADNVVAVVLFFEK